MMFHIKPESTITAFIKDIDRMNELTVKEWEEVKIDPVVLAERQGIRSKRLYDKHGYFA